LSLKQLQQDLEWKQSEVQRTMTGIFGRRPFTTYKKKCAEGTLGEFLEAYGRDLPDAPTAPQETPHEQTPQTV
jgi:hypothetical protein